MSLREGTLRSIAGGADNPFDNLRSQLLLEEVEGSGIADNVVYCSLVHIVRVENPDGAEPNPPETRGE